MKKLIKDTIQIYREYDGKLNLADYKKIIDYMEVNNYILVDDNINSSEFIEYVFEVAKYYLGESLIK